MNDKDDQKKSPKEKSFDELYEESLSLLKGVLDNIDKQPVNPNVPLNDIEKKLLEIEREFDEFLEASQGLFEVMSPQNEGEEVALPKNILRLLKKSEGLKERAEEKMKEIVETEKVMKELGVKKGKEEGKKSKEQVEKEAARKNKFRRIGGTRGWKPL